MTLKKINEMTKEEFRAQMFALFDSSNNLEDISKFSDEIFDQFKDPLLSQLRTYSIKPCCNGYEVTENTRTKKEV